LPYQFLPAAPRPYHTHAQLVGPRWLRHPTHATHSHRQPRCGCTTQHLSSIHSTHSFSDLITITLRTPLRESPGAISRRDISEVMAKLDRVERMVRARDSDRREQK